MLVSVSDACEGVPEDKDVQNDLSWFTYTQQFEHNLWKNNHVLVEYTQGDYFFK